MKKLKQIISWTIWSLLALYVLLVVLIQLPFTQRWLGQMVANALGSKLGTEVQVGRVDLGFFNRLIIDDVVIKDQQQQDLLTARRMSVKMELLPLINGRVSISSAQLFGANAILYKDSAAAIPNYQFVIDALSSKEKKEPSRFNLHIGSLIVRNLSVAYDQKDAPETPGRLNPHHLRVTDISAHVLLRTLTDDSLNVNIKRISLFEQSGLNLQRLALKLEANRQQALLTGFVLEMPGTSLHADTLTATDISDNFSYHLASMKGVIAMADLAAALPEDIPTHHDIAIDVEALSGTSSSLKCQLLDIATTDGDLKLQLSGQADHQEQTLQASLQQLSMSSNLINELQEVLPALPPLVGRLGSIDITADATTDDFGDIRAQGHASTTLGALSWRGTITPSPGSYSSTFSNVSFRPKSKPMSRLRAGDSVPASMLINSFSSVQ